MEESYFTSFLPPFFHPNRLRSIYLTAIIATYLNSIFIHTIYYIPYIFC
ncbi:MULTISPECIES: hypothetical protein [unclassified Clostridioides]|nr:hypothetical protein [Clostridioides sp. ZZV14-6387]MCI9974769.1 hypothetical protein [Clostridioides difficile]MDI7815378.1 hypothetical protein [Clostridioides difficile]NJJ37393.1 hypothetical protein [Clostridioides difficile]NJK13511.1 hypothetical protein [Clostridioides difficile]